MSATNNTKQALWVAIGSLFSFGFSIASSMILSRYFEKGDYGTYKQVMYVYNTLLAVFTLGLPRAYSYFIPRVKVEETKQLISKITRIFILLGAIFSLTIYTFAPQIALYMNNSDLEDALRIFAPVPLLMLPVMGLDGILACFQKNKFMTIYTVLTRLIMLVCVCVPVIVFKGGYKEGIAGFVVSSVITFFFAMVFKHLPIKNVESKNCTISYREILTFSLPLLVADIWGIIITSSDQFFISRYFGKVTFAEFANGSLSLPFVGMIVASCSTVLSPIISKLSYSSLNQQKELYPIWISVLKKSALLSYPILLYCWFFADAFMVLMYGEQYECSATYFQIKTLSDFLKITAFGPLIINVGRVKYYSKIHMFIAISVVVLEFITIKTTNSPYSVSVVSTLCQVGKFVAFFIFTSKYFQVGLKNIFPYKECIKIIIPSVLLLGLLHWILTFLGFNPIITLCISLPIYIIGLLSISIPLKLNYISLIKPLFIK